MAEIDTDTLACTYACLILHDDGLNIDAGSIMKLIKAANCEVESFWPSMFAKALQTSDINDLMMKGASAGAAPAPSAAAPAAAAAAAGGGAAPAAAAKKVEKEEEEEDMGFSLFD